MPLLRAGIDPLDEKTSFGSNVTPGPTRLLSTPAAFASLPSAAHRFPDWRALSASAMKRSRKFFELRSKSCSEGRAGANSAAFRGTTRAAASMPAVRLLAAQERSASLARRHGLPGGQGVGPYRTSTLKIGAVEKTRTSTAFRPQRPQRCASTSSATTARANTAGCPAAGRRVPLAKRIAPRNPPFMSRQLLRQLFCCCERTPSPAKLSSSSLELGGTSRRAE